MRRRRLVGLVLSGVLAVAAAGCGASDEAGPTPPPEPSRPSSATPVPVAPLAWEACEDDFECARLPVDGLELAVTRLPAGGRRIGALVVNPGGPGVSAVDYLQQAAEGLPEVLRERFDLVAFDPRGVGRSGAVRCGGTAQLDGYYALDPSPDDPGELAAYVQGNDRLVRSCAAQSGELLPQVSTRQAAADMDRLREALREPRLTYLGYSYGTALGAAYLRDFPTRVRAMVLDGALDPSLTWDQLLEGQSRGFDAAFEAFLADCERTRCVYRDAVDGDLGQAYDALAARVEQEPLRGKGSRPLGPGELSLGVGAGLYDREQGWWTLAQGLADAESGDGSTLLAMSDSYLERDEEGYSTTLTSNVAVNCLDRPWPREAAAYTAVAERTARTAPRFGPAIVLSGLTCASWPVPPEAEPGPVRGAGAPPVVVIGTTRDPATPYEWSVALAEQLESGVLIAYDGDGHTVYRDGAPACVQRPVDDYLVTGRAPAPLRC